MPGLAQHRAEGGGGRAHPASPALRRGESITRPAWRILRRDWPIFCSSPEVGRAIGPPCPRATLAGREQALLCRGNWLRKLAEGLAVGQRWQEIAAKHDSNPSCPPSPPPSPDVERLEDRKGGGVTCALTLNAAAAAADGQNGQFLVEGEMLGRHLFVTTPPRSSYFPALPPASSGLALECRAANGIPPPFPPHRHCPREPSLAPESKSCDLVPLFLHHQPPLRPPNPRLQPPPFCSPFEEETGEAQTLPQYGAPSLSYFFIGTVKAVAGIIEVSVHCVKPKEFLYCIVLRGKIYMKRKKLMEFNKKNTSRVWLDVTMCLSEGFLRPSCHRSVWSGCSFKVHFRDLPRQYTLNLGVGGRFAFGGGCPEPGSGTVF
ncbi:hypothetical protein E2320_004487 [Naja naja]|nr:hypothetical protein E2320_004487 [Naja naja]